MSQQYLGETHPRLKLIRIKYDETHPGYIWLEYCIDLSQSPVIHFLYLDFNHMFYVKPSGTILGSNFQLDSCKSSDTE